MLIGPGRWATKSPEMGVPVSFAEINTVSVLCEVAAMHEYFVPEVSLGTHFFNDLVEMDMLYLAIYPQKKNNTLNNGFFDTSENMLKHLLPDASSWGSVIQVIDGTNRKDGLNICLNADVTSQNAVCYLGITQMTSGRTNPKKKTV